MLFQSALHPKVKGISQRRIAILGKKTVSIRPSPKGEGNLVMKIKVKNSVTVSIRPSPKGEGNQPFLL